VRASIDDSLRLSASQAIAAVNIENGQLNFSDSLPEGAAAITQHERDLTIRLLDPRGQVLQAVGEFNDWPVTGASLAAAQQQRSIFETLTDPGDPTPVRFYTTPISENGGCVLAARALAPIDHITRTARRISAEDLSARLNLTASDDEVGRLAATFDSMLARLDESFKRERQFTADASHELRTPLAAMQAILGVIRRKYTLES